MVFHSKCEAVEWLVGTSVNAVVVMAKFGSHNTNSWRPSRLFLEMYLLLDLGRTLIGSLISERGMLRIGIDKQSASDMVL